ncbi:MAG: GH3 auxin-responsive promoter family protein [Candidatus Omnitrophica bacterium]|nr:GH3 auxin-responsive promoter family protein [Candidatus Omnitrophota bacterium]
MNIAPVIVKLLEPIAKDFEKATKNPVEAQKKILLAYLSRNKGTEYGKKYCFSSIKSIKEYREKVPLSNCETMRPFIERMAAGERNVLTKDEPTFFGITSGTSGKSKLIPSTKYSQKKKTDVMNIWSYYITKKYPRILNGKIFAVMSPELEEKTKSGLPCGAESGHGYRQLSGAIRRFYAIPYEAFDIKDFDSRYYTLLRIGMGENITTLATLNPSTIILLCQKIEKWQQAIIEDIREGSLNKNLIIHNTIRKKVEKTLRPNPGRAAFLEKILEEKKELLPKDFWPGLQLIECWKGGTMRLYLKEFPRYFGDTPIRDIGCLSTEARSSIPMSNKGADGALAINANFYEFIPKEDIEKDKKRLLSCEEVIPGKEYYLIITTPGGLYRYNIDDIVKVNSFFNKVPVIEFVQKGRSAVSLAGEKLYESQVSEAVIRALDKHNLSVKFFTAGIQWEQPPRYVFLTEFEGDPSLEDKKALLLSVEQELYIENREYEYTRTAGLLNTPILKILEKGEFEKYRIKKVAEGAHDSQFKVPELIGDVDFQKNFSIQEEIPLISG